MEKKLLDYLSEIPDKRRKQGRRYELDKVLALVLLGTFAGRVGYRSISRYGKEHEEYMINLLGFKHGIPSHVSLTSIVDGLDFASFERAVNNWSSSRIKGEGSRAKRGTKKGEVEDRSEVIALDGKAIKSSVRGGNTKHQNFICFVNAFCSEQQAVVSSVGYENGKQSEQIVLRDLVEQLGIKGAVFTMDANHDSKKH